MGGREDSWVFEAGPCVERRNYRPKYERSAQAE